MKSEIRMSRVAMSAFNRSSSSLFVLDEVSIARSAVTLIMSSVRLTRQREHWRSRSPQTELSWAGTVEEPPAGNDAKPMQPPEQVGAKMGRAGPAAVSKGKDTCPDARHPGPPA